MEGIIFLPHMTMVRPREPVLDVTFAFRHKCFYSDLSEEFPEGSLLVCCNDRRDIVEFVSSSSESIDSVIEKFRWATIEAVKSEDGNRVNIITDRCLCHMDEDEGLHVHYDLGVLQISERVFNNGWEHRRIVGFSNKHVQAIMEWMQARFPTKILSKRPLRGGMFAEIRGPSSRQLFGQMTERQMFAIQLACREGYYRTPRKVTTATLAKRFGTSRATYEEHLRKAENKLIRLLCDYMDLNATHSTCVVPKKRKRSR
ncbi:MAG: helix-turn-helix domain-containing protein [Thermoplasmata archaeon]